MCRDSYLYQPFYCEENIWHLCQNDAFKNSYVVFIASKNPCFPMLKQRAMVNSSTPIFWDYHVVLLVEADVNQISDFDTVLPFSSDVKTYFQESFLQEYRFASEYLPLFRVISSSEFVNTFVSDRSHMKTEQGWSAPPPNWPAISSEGSNLHEFTDMTNGKKGQVLSYHEFLERFS